MSCLGPARTPCRNEECVCVCVYGVVESSPGKVSHI